MKSRSNLKHRTLPTIAAGFVAVMAAVAILFAYLIVDRDGAEDNASGYDILWSATQSGVETARFAQALTVYRTDPDTENLDTLRLRLDILTSRSETMSYGAFRKFLEADAMASAIARDLATSVREYAVALADRPTSRAMSETDRDLRRLGVAMTKLAVAANTYNEALSERQRSNFEDLSLFFSLITAAALAAGAVLLFVVMRQNKAVRKAHDVTTLEHDRFETALANMGHGLCMVDKDGNLVVSNPKFDQMATCLRQAGEDERSIPDMLSCRIGSDGERALFDVTVPQGRTFSVTQAPMRDGGWISTFEDVTEKRTSDQAVSWMANHDGLTGLLNRTRFRLDVTNEVESDQPVTLLCMDLDRFKSVNDTLGHHVGDGILVEVAKTIRSVAGPDALITRVGGDEFAVAIRAGDERDPVELGESICRSASEPFLVSGHRVSIGISVGIASYPGDASDMASLFQMADVALYHAKKSLPGGTVRFQAGMDERIRLRQVYEKDLRLAVDRGDFELHFQPIVSLSGDRRTTCYETLVRWRVPDRGLVPPGDFIAVAEDTGLIVPLGAWILDQACHQASRWKSDVRVAVNISPIQFRRGDLVDIVSSCLARSGLDPRRLELEITESAVMEDPVQGRAILSALRAKGVRIALDDFGTGYSSLSHLRTFAFDKIKMDRSFMTDLDAGGTPEIVSVIANLGRALGMTVVAEGVETVIQAEIVRAAGCDEIQGYLFSRPKPDTEFPELWADVKVAAA